MRHLGTRALTTMTIAVALLIGAKPASADKMLNPQPSSSTNAAHGKLRIFFLDVEGGQSTLFVTPEGRSLLIDTGWPGNDGRDAVRIVAAAKSAGLSRIDAVLITHFHTDHVGGLPQLAARIPIGMFLDHGPNRESTDAPTVAGWTAYQKLLASGKYQHQTMHVGETLPNWTGNGGPKATVVSADGVVLAHPLPGAGSANSSCGVAGNVRPADVPAIDTTENARSLGIAIEWGKLRILDLGDLTWTKEQDLVCPANKLGRFTLLVVSHHGWEQSSSPALIDAVAPRVAIMDNGATKGGSPRVLDVIESAPSRPALWQLHVATEAGEHRNSDPARIANGVGAGADRGYGIHVTASQDGHLTVTNARTGASKDYPPS